MESKDTKKLKCWAFNPFDGGAHQDFLLKWQALSQHDWKNFTLNPSHWKWRVRQAPLLFARQAKEEPMPEVMFCTSMFNLCEFKGLHPKLSSLPSLMYFHENELTYPLQDESERDLHLAFSQFIAALSASRVLFNSEYHRSEYFEALKLWLKKMPGPSLLSEYDRLLAKSSVLSPGIADLKSSSFQKEEDALNLLWSARWEKDKNPKAFIDLLKLIKEKDLQINIYITGCQEDLVKRDLNEAQLELDQIKYIGFAQQELYEEILPKTDVWISSAYHEYFGLSGLTAAAYGAALLLPERCVYVDLYKNFEKSSGSVAFHDDSATSMLSKLENFQKLKLNRQLKNPELINWAQGYTWKQRCKLFDDEVLKLREN